MLTTCRRKFLLEYFGEKYSSTSCGTCDNCTSSKKDSDMSREAFLLMACVHSCGGHWGLNLPIDVLRGSRSKKILDAHFDKLPFHGLGKDMPANWWKALACQLIAHDYLVETFRDIYKTVRVGPKGMQFLNSCNPDYQPPLYLTLTPELESDNTSKDAVGYGVVNGSTQLEIDGLTQAEDQIYKMLVEERRKLARDHGTAPYALCGDQTLRRITSMRPSTRARLANIDGINQYFVTTYGDRLLQVIQHRSHEVGLSLDGEPIPEARIPSKVVTIHNNKRLTPAKFEAWKMWQEGYTFKQIVNCPGRGPPIKEQTVHEYILEAARDGCSIDWARFCREIGLTQEIVRNIQNAIAEVGKEKLKPIKNELPEEVTYSQIKVCLMMQEMGTMDFHVSSHQQGCKIDESRNGTSNLSLESGLGSLVDIDNGNCPMDTADIKQPSAASDDLTCCTRKRHKLDVPQVEQFVAVEITDDSVLNWLKNFEDGVSCASGYRGAFQWIERRIGA
ncbi:hypothetical protein OROGR_019717 [Orobanche gracilis]